MYIYLLIALSTTIVLLVVVSSFFIKYKKQVAQEKQMQSEFLAVMIHELRSPLSVVKSSADMLIKESAKLTAEQITEMLAQMKESSSGLLEIVNNLLDVAKLEAGKVELFKQECDVNKLLQKEADYYRRLADKSGLDLELNLDPTLKPIQCDSEKLIHVMNNLISNAVKYTESGTITIESKGYKKYVQVAVADTGMGVSDEAKSKLFNKYVQAAQNAESKGKGTGLGLVIVKGMIEAHNGRIWIEDNKPQGTRFVFTLPLS